MAQGLQTWDAAGNLMLDTNSRPGRIHGEIFRGGSGPVGSQVIPSLANGTPFFIVDQGYNDGTYYSRVSVSISGTTISWSAHANGFRIYYGTY